MRRVRGVLWVMSLPVLAAAQPDEPVPPVAPVAPVAPVSMGPIDHSLDAPPPPPRYLAKGFLAAGGALLIGGVVGTVFSPHCETMNARGDCVDARGTSEIFPILMAAGIVIGVVGSYLWRQDAPEPPP